MLVSKLEISGFRGVKSASVNFERLTILIGQNNCGKTTITEALALVLGRDRLIRALTEHDFYGSNPQPADRILIVATICDFPTNDPERNADWFRWGRGVVKWQDAGTGDIKANKDTAADKLCCQIAFAARFDHESLETVTLRYFYDNTVDPFDEESGVALVPAELVKKIGFFLVPASRTWDRTISFGSELFRRVVAYVGGKPAEAILAERARLRSPEKPIERDDNVKGLIDSINNDLNAILGKRTETKLRVTSTDSDGILDAIVPHFSYNQGQDLPARRHGSGLISLQTLALLMRFGQIRVAAGDGFMMVVEEPELHVPPPLQRKLIRMLQAMTTQTVITSHSPTVASVPEPHQISVTRNNGGSLTAAPLSEKLGANSPNLLRHLLFADRQRTVHALMHETLLICEGLTDAAWLGLFVRALEADATELDEGGLAFAHQVGVLAAHNAQVEKTLEHLATVAAKTCCLYDGDSQGNNYQEASCRVRPPPAHVIRWPKDWTIENVVGWIADADPVVLSSQLLRQEGLPATSAELVAALATTLKSHEIAHGVLMDELSKNPKCRARIRHVLTTLGQISCLNNVPPTACTKQQASNGVTLIWTFRNDVSGI